jgi:hypothetical protein
MFKRIAVHVSILFALFFLTAFSTRLTAQTDSGVVAGVAVDRSGAVVTDAKVTLTNTGTNAERTVTTNNSGEYTFASVRAGVYTITASAQGFIVFESILDLLFVGVDIFVL